MLIKTDIGLLGDSIGTIPVLIALSKYANISLFLGNSAKNARQIYEMIPKNSGIQITEEEYEDSRTFSFDLSEAFDVAIKKDLHMTQAHFERFGLKIPEKPIKPDLELPISSGDIPVYDYVLAPFSRCLPESQKWPQDNWNKLVDRMEDRTFVVFGNDKYDSRDFIFEKPHVKHMYSKPLAEAMNVMTAARCGVLSVVTGISHFAYPLGVKNFLFNNQNMKWGINPDAICMEKPIRTYSPQEVENILRKNV